MLHTSGLVEGHVLSGESEVKLLMAFQGKEFHLNFFLYLLW